MSLRWAIWIGAAGLVLAVAAPAAAQGGCSYSVSSTSIEAPPNGSSYTIEVDPDPASGPCPWTVTSEEPWAIITDVTNPEAGSGRFEMYVQNNPGPAARSGWIQVNGVRRVFITENWCTATVTPSGVTASPYGGTYALAVHTEPAGQSCPWSAFSGVAWIAANGSGSGDGTLSVSVGASDPMTPFPRSGYVMVFSGNQFMIGVTQARMPCHVSINPARIFAPTSGLTSRITVLAELVAPPGPAAPGAFDYQRQAWFEGIGAVGFAYGGIRAHEPGPPSSGWSAAQT